MWGLNLPLLALKMEGAMSREVQVASRIWKGEGNRLSAPEPLEKNTALLTH